jgi:hypothetical protein
MKTEVVHYAGTSEEACAVWRKKPDGHHLKNTRSKNQESKKVDHKISLKLQKMA